VQKEEEEEEQPGHHRKPVLVCIGFLPSPLHPSHRVRELGAQLQVGLPDRMSTVLLQY
jgi:hypothetical protein